MGVTSTVANGNGGYSVWDSYITIAGEGEPQVLSSANPGQDGIDGSAEPLAKVIEDSQGTALEFTGNASLGSSLDKTLAVTQIPAPQNAAPVIYAPDRIRIPVISLDAPVVPVSPTQVELDGQLFNRWLSPNEMAAGWHDTSVPLDQPGNTVLNGHNNIFGDVFGRLEELETGDKITVYSGTEVFVYEVTNKMILRERYQSIETRMSNAQWLERSEDERLTLVTCWPKWGNSHRLIIVAKPVTHYQDSQANH